MTSTPQPLYAVLEQHKHDILRAWRVRVVDELVPHTIPRAELIDSIPIFLEELIDALGREGHPPPPAGHSAGREHGKQRLHLGFDVAGVVREYALLRECIFECFDAWGQAVTPAELHALWRCFDTSVAEAVTQYALERDRELRERTGKHIGFLAHELRNPLNSALLAVDALRDRGVLAGSREADMLGRNLERMRRLVDQTLVEGKLQAGIEVRREPVRLREILTALEAECRSDAERRRVLLRLHCDEGLVVAADARYLHSALSNLVRNALKFTREGGTATVRARSGVDNVLIEVEDECGGLPPGAVEKLFDPFVQVGADHSGFGLGLAIAKQAVDAHGGALRVHNLPGRGCVFTLELPIEAPEGQPGSLAGARAVALPPPQQGDAREERLPMAHGQPLVGIPEATGAWFAAASNLRVDLEGRIVDAQPPAVHARYPERACAHGEGVAPNEAGHREVVRQQCRLRFEPDERAGRPRPDVEREKPLTLRARHAAHYPPRDDDLGRAQAA
jgi:signal transduction histidine kinase